MPHDPAAVLKLFFAIGQRQIDRDVAEGQRDREKMLAEGSASLAKLRDSNDPQLMARHHHEQLVRAKVLRSQDDLREECRLYFAYMAADRITDEAVTVAFGSGRLAELGRQMDEIQQREGLTDTEFWMRGEGPDDYEQLSQQSNELYEQVYDTVLTTVLRLDDVAQKYENDRPQLEEQVEQGRRILFGDALPE